SAEPGQADATGSAPRGLMLVDPLLRRVGALAVVIALFIPVALALRNGGSDDRSALEPSSTALTIAPTPAPAVAAADGSTTIDIDALPPAIPVNGVSNGEATSGTEAAGTEAPTATDNASDTTAPPSASQPAQVEGATPAAASSCKKYTVVAGDYWFLIAKKVSVSVGELLDANNANASTALFPGGVICLPANASAPTTAAPTTAAPTTTVKVTTTTTKVTTTTSGGSPVPVKTTYTKAEVEAIIRYVWPDNLEDEAVRIATRESNLTPGVRNFCCYGLFQIYFSVHRVWLAQSGVTSAEQLYDPLTNAYIAYALYLKAGGWGPWKL
ncbi:MAG: LysM peptidoglycan-binding domain-containing protein, partial [Ilumatobacteraceae bacterium]